MNPYISTIKQIALAGCQISLVFGDYFVIMLLLPSSVTCIVY